MYTLSPQLPHTHTHTVIFLHGRDSDATEFAQEFFESQALDGRTLPEIFPEVRWVFPASKMRYSKRFDTQMSQWFDIWSVEKPDEQQELQIQGLQETLSYLSEVIKTEASYVAHERIFLGGISQGCASAITALLCNDIKLAGFIGFCGWLPLYNKLQQVANDTASDKYEKSETSQHDNTPTTLANATTIANLPLTLSVECSKLNRTAMSDVLNNIIYKQAAEVPLEEQTISSAMGEACLEEATTSSDSTIPIFLSHCVDDDVVLIGNGQNLRLTLESLGFNVCWNAYEEGGHWVNEPKGIDDMATFIKSNW